VHCEWESAFRDSESDLSKFVPHLPPLFGMSAFLTIIHDVPIQEIAAYYKISIAQIEHIRHRGIEQSEKIALFFKALNSPRSAGFFNAHRCIEAGVELRLLPLLDLQVCKDSLRIAKWLVQLMN
jgi:hypothetical protein